MFTSIPRKSHVLARTRGQRDQRSFLLQRAQPAMTGLIDGSLSTLVDLHNARRGNHRHHRRRAGSNQLITPSPEISKKFVASNELPHTVTGQAADAGRPVGALGGHLPASTTGQGGSVTGWP